jgi:2-dehydropantoate 2-reductase
LQVSVVGAGALGTVYGARLAAGTEADVSLVVRAARAHEARAIRIEHVDHGEALDWQPERVTQVPGHADVVLVCVRYEQLDDALVALLRAGPDVPAVFLTPLLPQDLERMHAALSGGAVAAMPGVAAYARDDGVVRYWTPRVAHTLVDETRSAPALVEELVRALDAAGLHAKIEMGVHELNPATTVSLAPLAMALDAAGGIDALLDDGDVLALALGAAEEGRALAHTIGRAAAWASLLLRFVGPLTLKVGVSVARNRSAEVTRFVEEHFGRKLHAQNVTMGARMIELARTKGTPTASLEELLARMRTR